MSVPEITSNVAASTGAGGFLFEKVMEGTLKLLVPAFEEGGYSVSIYDEQKIRDLFNEQSLNGVDHLVELKHTGGQHILFFMQEKWKLVTNQREVSQFLDCCSRIKSRMVGFQGDIYKFWITRTVPTENGAKSLEEGGAYVVQTSTSMNMLAASAALLLCEVIGKRELAIPMIRAVPSFLLQEIPQETVVRNLDVKLVPAPTFKASKVKVNVRREETEN